MSGEGFEPTGKDRSDSQSNVKGLAGVVAKVSVELFLKEPVFDEVCMRSEWGWTW